MYSWHRSNTGRRHHPRLAFHFSETVIQPLPAMYSPSLCLIIQGQKRIKIGQEELSYGAGQYLVAGFDLPVIGTVTKASKTVPYVCIQLNFDRNRLLLMEERVPKGRNSLAYGILHTPVSLLSAVSRLVKNEVSSQYHQYLSELYEQEVLFHVLVGPYGDILRRFIYQDERSASVNRAITYLKESFREPFNLQYLLAEAGRSKSSLYREFKSRTGISPLQFRTRLRLQEAKRLMLVEHISAAQAGFLVGYESPSYFNKAYHRLFGSPPKEDIERLRSACNEGAKGGFNQSAI